MEEEKQKAGEKHLRTINTHEPEKVALEYHSYYRGKIEIGLKAPVRSYDDFAIWYTPGVAEPSREIKKTAESASSSTRTRAIRWRSSYRILSEKANSFGILLIHLILLGDVIYIPNFNK